MALTETGVRLVAQGKAGFIRDMQAGEGAVTGFVTTAQRAKSGVMGFVSATTRGVSRVGSITRGAFGMAAGAVGGFVSATTGVIGGMTSLITRAGFAAFAVQQLASAAVGLGSALFGSNASMEQTRIAFVGLLGDAGKADAFLRDLQQFAATTPFEFPELTGAAQRLIGVGIAAQDVIPWMTAIGDAVAGMGGSAFEVDRVTTAITQMQAKGKITAEEMAQLTEANIPGWQALEKATGLSVAQLMDMSSKGLLPASKYLPLLISGMEQSFGGQMANQAKSFNGLLSTFRDNIGMAWRAFTGPMFEQAKGALTTLGDAVASPRFHEFATTMGQRVGTAVQAAVGHFGRLRTTVVSVAGAIQAGFAEGGLVGGIDAFLGRVGSMVPQIQPVTSFIRGTVIPSFQQFGSFISTTVVPALQQFGSFITTTIVPAIQQFGAWITGTALPAVQQFGQWIMGTAVPAVQRFAGFITTTIVPALQRFGGFITSTVVPALQEFGGWIGQHVGTIGRVALAIGMGVVAFSTLGSAISMVSAIVGGILTVIGSPLLIVLGLVAAAVTGLAFAWMTNFGNIRGVLNTFWTTAVSAFNAVKPALITVGTQIGELGGKFMGFIRNLLPAWESLKTAFQATAPLIAVAVGLIGAQIVGVIGFIGGALPGLGVVISGVVQVIAGVVTTIASLITGLVRIVVNVVSGNWAGAWNAAKEMVVGMARGVVSVISGLIGTIFGIVGALVGGVIGFFRNLYQVVVGGSIVPDMVNGIIRWIGQLPGRVLAFISSLVSQAIAKFNDWRSRATTAASNLATSVVERVTDLKNRAVTMVTTLVTSAVDRFNDMRSRVVTAITSLKDRALSIAASLVSSLQSKLDGLVSFVANLGGAFRSAGATIINMLKDGMMNAFEGVKNALSSGLQTLRNMLPFSEPRDRRSPLYGLSDSGMALMGELQKGIERHPLVLTSEILGTRAMERALRIAPIVGQPTVAPPATAQQITRNVAYTTTVTNQFNVNAQYGYQEPRHVVHDVRLLAMMYGS
jgi:tape measure domain-containing protein